MAYPYKFSTFLDSYKRPLYFLNPRTLRGITRIIIAFSLSISQSPTFYVGLIAIPYMYKEYNIAIHSLKLDKTNSEFYSTIVCKRLTIRVLLYDDVRP